MANLRVVYDNAADRASLSASTTAGSLAVSNLLTDIKSEIWRSTGSTATITLNWPAGELVGMVAFPFCSLSSGAQIRVRCYTLATDANPVFDTGYQMAAEAPPFDVWGWGSEPLGVNAYAYGGSAYGVVWFAIQTAQKMVIDIDDSSNPLGYIECSRIVTGTYWEATYNPEYGSVVVGAEDLSTHQRTDAGDLRTDRGAIYKTLTVDLSYLTPIDRNAIWRVLRGNSMSRPIYLSVVPQATDAFDEQIFQIYGKMTKGASMKYAFMNQYSSQLDIQEI